MHQAQLGPHARFTVLVLFGKLVVGLQLQYASGCLSPSVTGQAFFGDEGSATHPGSSLRLSPSFVGEGRILKTRTSRFYFNYVTPPCLHSLIPIGFRVQFLDSFSGFPFRVFSGFPFRVFFSFSVAAYSWCFPCYLSNRYVEYRAFGVKRAQKTFLFTTLMNTPRAKYILFRSRISNFSRHQLKGKAVDTLIILLFHFA